MSPTAQKSGTLTWVSLLRDWKWLSKPDFLSCTGIPLYARSFENTAGLGLPYDGVGPGTTDPGIYSYTDLPFAGATVHVNTTDVSSYSYDPNKRELVSFDTPHIASLKAQYVMSKGLAGQMFWDVGANIPFLPITLADIFQPSFPRIKLAMTRWLQLQRRSLAILTRQL